MTTNEMSHKSCDEMLDTADADSKVEALDTPITGADDGIVHTKDLYNRKIWFSRPRKNDPDAVKKLGRIRSWVFHPKDLRCVGFLVKRPDVALMFHRQDTFVAFNGFDIYDGDIVVKDEPGATDRSACKALGVNLDDCVLWIGLPVLTRDGTSFGLVGNVNYDAETGKIISLDVDSGATANALLGHLKIPAKDIIGFRRGKGVQLYITDDDDPESLGAIMVSDAVKNMTVEGGIAEKAGTATAVVADKAKKSAEKVKPKVKQATKAAGKAVNKGAYVTGRQIARTQGMFGKFKDNFKSAMQDQESDDS